MPSRRCVPVLLQAVLVVSGQELCSGGSCKAPAGESVLLQRSSNIQVHRSAATCAPYGEWPDVVGGVTCHGCIALVLTAPYGGRCDKYCESFGHYCMGAAESAGDSCDIKAPRGCHEVVSETSDMLCTCHRSPSQAPASQAPPQVPAPLPSQAPPRVLPQASVNVRIVSYNLFWWNAFGRNPWKGNHVTSNIKEELLADSIGLQECDEPGLIQARTGMVPASPFKGAQGVMVRPGLFEVGETGAGDLKAAGKWGTRYVTWARLTHKASGRSFWHFNTHWCVHSGNGRSCSPEKRYAGAKNMLQIIREKAGDEPVIITGDFNAQMGEPGPQYFLRNGFTLAVEHWVDAIFYSTPHWQKGWAGKGHSAKSDHNPVIAELTLK